MVFSKLKVFSKDSVKDNAKRASYEFYNFSFVLSQD